MKLFNPPPLGNVKLFIKFPLAIQFVFLIFLMSRTFLDITLTIMAR